jgi:hypothetical protein
MAPAPEFRSQVRKNYRYESEMAPERQTNPDVSLSTVIAYARATSRKNRHARPLIGVMGESAGRKKTRRFRAGFSRLAPLKSETGGRSFPRPPAAPSGGFPVGRPF